MFDETDRELLELAAKAAGYKVKWVTKQDVGMLDQELVDLEPHSQHFRFVSWPHHEWNPLTDDGDALRLAVTLGMVVQPFCYDEYSNRYSLVVIYDDCGMEILPEIRCYDKDVNVATRRAIVRAAAEIGRSK